MLMIIFRGWELKIIQDIMVKTFRKKILESVI